MTLAIPNNLKHRREHIRKLIFEARKDLINAYRAKSPERIRKQKITLARHLRELAESPELGPPLQFNWGNLEIVYKFNFDSDISWLECLETEGNYFRVACLLEKSAHGT